MKRRSKFALLLTFCIAPLQCATLERLSLDDMIAKSTAIVRGRILGSSSTLAGRVIYTHYSVQVMDRYKGATAATVDVAVPGGVAGGLRQTFSGSPEFRPGDEYVLFLWTGRSGMTQVIGLTQGVFSIAADASADPTATRAATRELMLAPGTGKRVKDQTLVMRLSELRGRISGTLGAAVKGATQ